MFDKIKVLIVEDNEDERMFMIDGFLQEGHYEIVAEAGNGVEMLEVLNEDNITKPQVVITDLNMPGKDGYDVLRDIKSHKALSHIPVIVLTTAPYIPFAERCKQLGACAYFTKPDTFLQYKEFAHRIYSELKENCLPN